MVFLLSIQEISLVMRLLYLRICCFVTISMLSLFNNRQVKAIYLTSLLVASLLSYYILSFVLVYSSTLNYQKKHSIAKQTVLTDDLKML